MFTGIVQQTGTVRRAERRGELLVVEVAAAGVLEGLALGSSIAVDGCCLTVVELTDGGFWCELSGETLARSAFAERLRPGASVNLERPLPVGGRLEGHIVQGHVDGVGRVRALDPREGWAELTVEVPPDLERYLVVKGSVAVDGVSLTVAALGAGAFTVALIPYTLAHTNLGLARPGDRVHLEMDVLAKYVERLLAARRPGP